VDNTNYQRYPFVDTAVGNRLLLGFIVNASAIQRRLPAPWRLASLPAFEAIGLPAEQQPNLLLAFHHLLIDQDAQGQVLTEAGSRFLVFDIPASNPDTGERGLLHFLMFTGGAIPGRYRDALPARVKHDYQVVEDHTATTIREAYQIQPEAGGLIEVQLTAQRGILRRQTASSPNFSLWSAVDPTIQRVYQEDSVMELLRNNVTGFNSIQELSFHAEVPALSDLFDGSERLAAVIANPYYMRRVFSPRREPAVDDEL
jgi:hypothetical protein